MGYYPADERMPERLRRVCEEIHRVPESAIEVDHESHVVTIDYTQVRDWFEASRECVPAVRAGDKLVIRPPWSEHEPSPGDLVIEIDPGAAFGSGLHESTCLCLRAMERHLTPGVSAVDFGTGSGVLAIAAAKLGAKHVLAIDISPVAVDIARSNVSRNDLDGVVEVAQGEEAPVLCGEVGIITANITAETITRSLSGLSAVLDAGGLLIASGMTSRNAPDVERMLPEQGFDVLERLHDDVWVAIVAQKRESGPTDSTITP